jgi:hypothetical protein
VRPVILSPSYAKCSDLISNALLFGELLQHYYVGTFCVDRGHLFTLTLIFCAHAPGQATPEKVLRKVNLACPPGEERWYGDSDHAERFSLFDSFDALAGADVDGPLSLARELDDPSIRIHSLISITRAAARKAHGSVPTATRGG